MLSALFLLLLPVQSLQVPASPQATQSRTVWVPAQRAAPTPAPAQAGRGGWLGVELSESGSGDDLRLEITGVTDGSAAARAGLRAGDRIESLNDRPARGYAEFASMVQGHGPGTRVQITIERDTEARLGEAEGQPRLGINLDDASISSVSSGSPAEQAALQAGDRLLEVGGQACESGDDVINAVHSHEPGEVIGITLRRVVPVVLGSRPGSSDELMTEPAEPRFDDSTRVEDERRAVAADQRAAEAAERRTAEVSRLQAQVRELSAALERLRQQLDELQRELDSLR